MNAKQGQRWGIILVFAGFAIGIPGFWLLIAHDHFEATARIQVTHSGVSDDVQQFIQAQLEEIKSETILTNVVVTMHLDAEWGTKYAEGRKLDMNETLSLLRQSLHLLPVNKTRLIDICVISEDAVEAAKIANAVANAYSDLSNRREAQLRDAVNRLAIMDSSPVIIDVATLPASPIGPNRTLGKSLIGVGVLLLVCGFVTFVRNWRRPDEAVG